MQKKNLIIVIAIGLIFFKLISDKWKIYEKDSVLTQKNIQTLIKLSEVKQKLGNINMVIADGLIFFKETQKKLLTNNLNEKKILFSLGDNLGHDRKPIIFNNQNFQKSKFYLIKFCHGFRIDDNIYRYKITNQVMIERITKTYQNDINKLEVISNQILDINAKYSINSNGLRAKVIGKRASTSINNEIESILDISHLKIQVKLKSTI